MPSGSKKHEPLDGPKRQKQSLLTSYATIPKGRIYETRSDGIIPDSQESQLSDTQAEHESSKLQTTLVRSSAHLDKNSKSRVQSPDVPKMEPQTPTVKKMVAVKNFDRWRSKSTQKKPRLPARAVASSPIRSTRLSLDTPKPKISVQPGEKPRSTSKIPVPLIPLMVNARKAAPITKTESTASVTQPPKPMSTKSTSSVTLPSRSKNTSDEGRQDPYAFTSDSDSNDYPRHKVKSSKRTSVSRKPSKSTPITPAQTSADDEVILLEERSSNKAPGSHISSDNQRTPLAGQSKRGKFRSGSILVSLYDHNEMPASSPPFNPRPDTVNGFHHSQNTPVPTRPGNQIPSHSSRFPTDSDDESDEEDTPRKLDLPPMTKAAEKEGNMERTKQYVLTDGTLPQTQVADRVLNSTRFTPFLASKGRSSPLSAVSQTTSALIAEQLMETCAPPSNQELAALMSSSPAKAGRDEWNYGGFDGGVEERSRNLARMSLELLYNRENEQGGRNGVDDVILETQTQTETQSTGVLRSQSTTKPNHHIPSITRNGEEDTNGNTTIPFKEIQPNSVEVPFNATREKLSRLTKYYTTPERAFDPEPTPSPKSFYEINGATSTQAELVHDSDAEALTYVLRRSPQWLNSVDGLDVEPKAEKDDTKMDGDKDGNDSQMSTPRPILPTKKSALKPLAHASKTTNAHPDPEGRRSSDSSNSLPLLKTASPSLAEHQHHASAEAAVKPKEIVYQKEEVIPEDLAPKQEELALKEKLAQKEKEIQKLQQQVLQLSEKTNSNTPVATQSPPGSGKKGARKAPSADDTRGSNHKKQKVSHGKGQGGRQQQQQQQHTSSTGRKRRQKGKKARLRRQEQDRQRQLQHLRL